MVDQKPEEKKESIVLSPPKKAIVFDLEGVLLPSEVNPGLDTEKVKVFLKETMDYCQKQGILTYLISGYPLETVTKKINEAGLDSFFEKEHVKGVTQEYLDKMEKVDRERYEQRCEEDPNCQDEYFRQVELMNLLKENNWKPNHVVLIGRDYWFDGFYTRRFSKVDILFVSESVANRGKKPDEKVPGVWSFSHDFATLKIILDGKQPIPNYKPLDTWINVTLSEALFGGKGLPVLKRVILERKSDGSRDFTVKKG